MDEGRIGKTQFRFRGMAVLLTMVPAAIGLFSALNNITGASGTLENVIYPMLSMEGTYGNPLQTWRAIPSHAFAQLVYLAIGLCEASVGVICAVACWKMLRALRGSIESFRRELQTAQLGMMLGIFVWLFFFGAVAGDWFLVWQNASLKPLWVDSFQYATMVFLTLASVSLIDHRLARSDFL